MFSYPTKLCEIINLEGFWVLEESKGLIQFSHFTTQKTHTWNPV